MKNMRGIQAELILINYNEMKGLRQNNDISISNGIRSKFDENDIK